MPSLSLFISCFKTLILADSRALSKSPSGGPSRMSLSSDRASWAKVRPAKAPLLRRAWEDIAAAAAFN